MSNHECEDCGALGHLAAICNSEYLYRNKH
jgi:hypothetical protein